MGKRIFLIIILTLNLEASNDETYVGVDGLIQHNWKNDPHISTAMIDLKKYNWKKEDYPSASKIFEEGCSIQYDVFCGLFYGISKDSPPKYDNWLTKEENKKARKKYYSSNEHQSITLKIPLKLSLCEDDFYLGKYVLDKKGYGFEKAACYSINKNKFRIFILRSNINTEFTLTPFDVKNPHGIYCKSPYYYSYFDWYGKYNSPQSYIGGTCYEFSSNENIQEAVEIARNQKRMNRNPTESISHLIDDYNSGSYDELKEGRDFNIHFSLTQKVRNTSENKISEKGKEILEVSEESLKEKYTWEIFNTIHVIGKSKIDASRSLNKWIAHEYIADRDFVKENFDKFNIYAVVTIPLVERQMSTKQQYGIRTYQRSYYGFFKGYEIGIDNKLLDCSYDCDLTKPIKSQDANNNQEIKRLELKKRLQAEESAAQEKRIAEEKRRVAEEQRRVAEEKAKAELAAEKRRKEKEAEEKRRVAEEKRRVAEELNNLSNAIKIENERQRKQKEWERLCKAIKIVVVSDSNLYVSVDGKFIKEYSVSLSDYDLSDFKSDLKRGRLMKLLKETKSTCTINSNVVIDMNGSIGPSGIGAIKNALINAGFTKFSVFENGSLIIEDW